MLDFLSKRASAAHLALVAVAPLVLCKYFSADAVCAVVVWLSLIAAVWAVVAPVHEVGVPSASARDRFIAHLLSDPACWVAMLFLAYASVAALNSGACLAYDAELKLWKLRPPAASMLPGGVVGSGTMYFAAALASAVLYPSVVHSLDSRQSVYFAVFAASTVVIDALFAYASGTGVGAASATAYGFFALMAGAAAFSAERSNRRVKEMIAAIAMGGCVTALLFAGRPLVLYVFVAALLAVALLFVGLSFRELGVMGVIRALLLLFVALGAAAMIYNWLSGEWAKLVPVLGTEADPVLDRFAIDAWKTSPWTGVGAGAYPLVAKMAATAEDWMTLGPMPDFCGRSWRLLLSERGMIGVLVAVAAVGAMLYTWGRYAWQRGIGKFAAAVPLLPIAVAAAAALVFLDGSALGAEAVVAFAALAAFSVNGGQ